MKHAFAEPTGFAKEQSARVISAIMKKQVPGKAGAAVMIALLYQRHKGVEIDRGVLERMERAGARLFDRRSVRAAGAGVQDVDRARVLLTDTALQHVAGMRVRSGCVGMHSERAHPDIRHLEELGEFSSLGYLADRGALKAVAEGSFHEAPFAIALEMARQLERSLKPMSRETEALLESINENYVGAILKRYRDPRVGRKFGRDLKGAGGVSPAVVDSEVKPFEVDGKGVEPSSPAVMMRHVSGHDPPQTEARAIAYYLGGLHEYARVATMAGIRHGSSVDIVC